MSSIALLSAPKCYCEDSILESYSYTLGQFECYSTMCELNSFEMATFEALCYHSQKYIYLCLEAAVPVNQAVFFNYLKLHILFYFRTKIKNILTITLTDHNNDFYFLFPLKAKH